MQTSKPDWFDKWVITDIDNWHLAENAPEEIKKEFNEMMKFINNKPNNKSVENDKNVLYKP